MGFNLSQIVNENLNVKNANVTIHGKNLFNRSVAENGGVVPATGASNASTGWYRTGYIEIEEFDFFLNSIPTDIVINALASSTVVGTAFYNESKTFISGITNTDIIANGKTIPIPAGAKYFRSSGYGTKGASLMQIEYGKVTTQYEEYSEKTLPHSLARWSQISGKDAPFVRNYSMPNDIIDVDGYSKIIDRDKYQIYNSSVNTVTAIYRDIAVQTQIGTLATTIKISTNGISGEYSQEVTFDATNFPGLIENSKIIRIMISPWTRNKTSSQPAQHWRLIVITSAGQIYHNYPSRSASSDGSAVSGDILKFEESVIWDLPERKFPSTNVAATGVERYFPCLPSVCYEYHPILNTDGSFVDTYGNGGFGISITKTPKDGSVTTYPRFYVPSRNPIQNSFAFMGGNEAGDKLTLIGTYQDNNGAGEGCRICLFATDDGGRQWYCKYEFANENATWVNGINTTEIVGDYTASSFVIKKRTCVNPSSVTKEPTNKFTLGLEIIISTISKANPAVITTAAAHGLATGNVVAILDNGASSDTSADWDWMRNDTISESSGGTGVLFKVKVLTSTTFELYEYIHSAFNNLAARHIHHINRIKDGWILGTGEEYPAGWLLYIQMKAADSFDIVNAYDNLSVYRLNSTAESIQRTLGVLLLDDIDNTVIAAIDTAHINRSNLTLPTGRTDEIMRNSIGIFKGKLSDVDDFTKFYPIYESKHPTYFFKEKEDAWIFCGQGGEFAISLDKGLTWSTEEVSSSMQHFGGSYNKIIAIDNYLIALKA